MEGNSDSISGRVFELVKQNVGDFRGEEESYSTISSLAEKFDFGVKSDVSMFVSEFFSKLEETSKLISPKSLGVSPILRKNKEVSDLYDYLFGLEFLSPRYSLHFQGAKIEQLSPGQRGSLLLIFYLLVDKGRNPIILDQPEENLDNETVVSLLVPVLREAKKKRQVIMVTHNPNLAVVCDAEQIIFSNFDRTSNSSITYMPGSIENPELNNHVINVLEGSKPAFNNRRFKYQ